MKIQLAASTRNFRINLEYAGFTFQLNPDMSVWSCDLAWNRYEEDDIDIIIDRSVLTDSINEYYEYIDEQNRQQDEQDSKDREERWFKYHLVMSINEARSNHWCESGIEDFMRSHGIISNEQAFNDLNRDHVYNITGYTTSGYLTGYEVSDDFEVQIGSFGELLINKQLLTT